MSTGKLVKIAQAYKDGKISENKVSAKIRHISRTNLSDITPQQMLEIINSPECVEDTLREIVSTKIPQTVKGEIVDVYTAQMLVTVIDKLNKSNVRNLLTHPLNEIISISYKVLTH